MKVLYKKIQNDQSGVASMLITMIMIFVIALIVLGFAQISRREQRLSLDRQLSVQAYYAAETGVNDAINAVANPAINYLSTYTNGKTKCGAMPGGDPLYTPVDHSSIDASKNTSYPCLLINPNPPSIQIQLDPTSADNQAQVVPINGVDPSTGNAQNIDTLSINWTQNPPLNSGFGACLTLFPTNWPPTCSTGVVRLDLVPVSAITKRDNLIANTTTMFFRPGSGSFGNTGLTQGGVVKGHCVTAGVSSCQVNIDVSSLNRSSYYARIEAIYTPAVVTVSATTSGGTTIPLKGAELLIDSTGKAQDVERRIQVRVPLNQQNPFPNYAIQSGDSICKRFVATPGQTPELVADALQSNANNCSGPNP